MLTEEAIWSGSYPLISNFWDAFEVPWGLYAETPQAALLFGLKLAAAHYRAGERPLGTCDLVGDA